jgi:hypothetical protein
MMKNKEVNKRAEREEWDAINTKLEPLTNSV